MKQIFALPAVLGIVAMGTGAIAQGDTAFARCGAIADRDSRLACYDSLQNNTVPAPPAIPSGHYPEFGPRSTPQASPEPQNTAGAVERGRLNGPLIAAISTYALARDGHFRITLDNGQIWEQMDSDGARAQFRSRGNRAMITPGFWHSFDMRLNDSSAIFKVERVR